MAKTYVVLNGRKTGIFDSWEECQASILKFKDAAYKSFTDKSEAEDFYMKNKTIEPDTFELGQGTARIFVAGAHDAVKDKYGFAYSIQMIDQIITEAGIEPLPLVYGQKEQTGEIEAVVHAINRAKELGLYSVLICYTHSGTGSWANGAWNTKKDGPVYYKKNIDECIMDIRFTPVPEGLKEMDNVIRVAKEALCAD